MAETIEAKELQLVDIFGDNYRFEIPEYQRPYAWTTEQTGELLDDLRTHWGGLKTCLGASQVLLDREYRSIKNGLRQAQIVDGQQRITTLTILLCVLRELASRVTRTHIVMSMRRAGSLLESRDIIVLLCRAREFFQNYIQQSRKLPFS